MEWINRLKNMVVAIDTSPFIYLIEENETYLDNVRSFFNAMEQGEFKVVTSMVSLLEVLVHPIRHNRFDLIDEYREILLDSINLSTLDISREIAEESAKLRASYNIRTPDAIQLATAIINKASYFLNNDNQFPNIPQLQMLNLDALIKI